MLDVSVLDAFIGGLSTAFFGALVAGGAYLLREQMILRERVAGLVAEVLQLRDGQRAINQLGNEQLDKERFKPIQDDIGGDAHP